MNIASVSEVKNGLSAYLRQVSGGQEILITEHRRPVARLVPAGIPEESQSAWIAAKAAEGVIVPPSRKLDWKALAAIPLGGEGAELSRGVIEERQGR